MLERVRENTDETGVILRLRGAISLVLLAGKEWCLGGPRSTLRLHPAPPAVGRNHRAGIQTHQRFPKSRVGHFQRDAANVFIAEEILTYELEVVEGAGVEQTRLDPPARKEAIVACGRHLRLLSH